jgi:hypothetical protein
LLSVSRSLRLQDRSSPRLSDAGGEAGDAADSNDGHSHIVFIASGVFFLFSLRVRQ